MNDIMVSISCITYNHEKYIVDAIESFLMQKTNFKYEILINDDASTDKTPEIIKKYEKLYPDLIKPMYHKENQYSKILHVDIFNLERAKGKYIAICEGDDFWVDPYKLQKQVDFMEENPDYSLCVHAAYKALPDKKFLKLYIRPSHRDREYKIEEVILGGGGLFATNSILYPAKYKDKPEFYKNAPVGDYPLVIYLSSKGRVHYIDQFMSAYRVGVEGSWSSTISSNIEKQNSMFIKVRNMLEEIDEYFGYKYNSEIKRSISNNRFEILLDQGKYKELKKGDLLEVYSGLSVFRKVKIFIRQYFPKITKILTKIKRKIGK